MTRVIWASKEIGGITVSIDFTLDGDSAAFNALLSTPNVKAVERLLITHKSSLEIKVGLRGLLG